VITLKIQTMKITPVIILTLAATAVFGQDTTRTTTVTNSNSSTSAVAAPATPKLLSKKGEPILPEKGDLAIGIDATPIFRYLGNSFNGNTGNAAPTFDAPGSPFTVFGKYFDKDKSAYRFKLRLGMSTRSKSNYVIQDNVIPDPNVLVKDTRKSGESTMALAFGKENRRGSGRVQGFYGVEGMVMLSTQRSVYTYGNPMSATFNSPTTTSDFDAGTSAALPGRVVESQTGTTAGIGARVFIGAEVFIFPKLSLGGELGWGVGLLNQGDGTVITERWDTGNADIKRETTKTGGLKQFGYDAGVNGQMGMSSGYLTLMFHF
jgi:hypothetical protein